MKDMQSISMSKKLTITIGIPAFQAEANIAHLLGSLIKQKEDNIAIERILVYTDGCTDKTVDKAISVDDGRIKLFVGKVNRGYAFSLQYLIDKNESQVFVALNDDIKLKSSNVIEYLVEPILSDSRVGLVGGNVCALKPQTFIGRCIYTSYLAFLPLRLNYKNGLSRLTNDGKIMALKKKFSKKLDLKNKSVGNVDIYIYLMNLKEENNYQFARNAKAYFRLSETIKDFRNQELRIKKSYAITKDQFKDFATQEWEIPSKEYLINLLKVFIRFPLESIFFKLVINNFLFVPRRADFTKWEIATSTKKL